MPFAGRGFVARLSNGDRRPEDEDGELPDARIFILE